jgi:hypothetical protein
VLAASIDVGDLGHPRRGTEGTGDPPPLDAACGPRVI